MSSKHPSYYGLKLAPSALSHPWCTQLHTYMYMYTLLPIYNTDHILYTHIHVTCIVYLEIWRASPYIAFLVNHSSCFAIQRYSNGRPLRRRFLTTNRLYNNDIMGKSIQYTMYNYILTANCSEVEIAATKIIYDLID